MTSEFASDPSQCVDGGDADMIAARIVVWRRTLPSVSLNPRSRLAAFARDWRQLLIVPAVGINEDCRRGISDVA